MSECTGIPSYRMLFSLRSGSPAQLTPDCTFKSVFQIPTAFDRPLFNEGEILVLSENTTRLKYAANVISLLRRIRGYYCVHAIREYTCHLKVESWVRVRMSGRLPSTRCSYQRRLARSSVHSNWRSWRYCGRPEGVLCVGDFGSDCLTQQGIARVDSHLPTSRAPAHVPDNVWVQAPRNAIIVL